MLQELNAEVRACPACRLSETRKSAVPGEGSERAEIMFVGEAPGYWENEQGRPFVGPAGQMLNELLAMVGLRREDVYITNIVKCRPPGNRDPLPDEIAACGGYLDRQIELIKPRVIVTLGRFSMAKFFPPGKGMRDLHGRVLWRDGIACVAMYHPAAALRQPSLKAILEEDFRKIPEILAQARGGSSEQAEEEPSEAQQLSLF